MKLFHFLFILSFLGFSTLFISCKKRCINPDAIESDSNGNCVFASDIMAGTYEVRDSARLDSMGTSHFLATKTYTLTIVKTDNNNVIVKNLGNCVQDFSMAANSTFSLGFGTTGNCYNSSSTVVGNGAYDKASKDFSLAYNFSAPNGNIYHAFLKAKKK